MLWLTSQNGFLLQAFHFCHRPCWQFAYFQAIRSQVRVFIEQLHKLLKITRSKFRLLKYRERDLLWLSMSISCDFRLSLPKRLRDLAYTKSILAINAIPIKLAHNVHRRSEREYIFSDWRCKDYLCAFSGKIQKWFIKERHYCIKFRLSLVKISGDGSWIRIRYIKKPAAN